MKSFSLFASVAALLTSPATAKPQEDKVTSMPEFPSLPSDIYSGYLPVTDTKKLHYVFVESMD
jgi:hypothetical protein